jgi:hypothetical protein
MTSKIILGTVLVVVFVAVVGCATQAQRRSTQINNEVQTAVSEAQSSLAQIKKTGAFRRLQDRYILDAFNEKESVRKMLITEYASEQDRADLLALNAIYQDPRRKVIEHMTNVDPRFGTLFAAHYSKSDLITVATVKGELTIGERNAKVMEAYHQFMEKFTALAQEVQAGLQASHSEELASRQAAAQALQQWSIQQQMLNQMNRPTQTNCTWLGSTLNCTSW